ERAKDRQIREALRAAGIEVTDEQFAAANRKGIESFAPNIYQAIVWTLTAGHPEARQTLAGRSWPGDGSFELRPGVPDLLKRMHDRGLLLGLAANQPAETVKHLDELGIGQYLQAREVSADHGFRKPDVRLFLRACEQLGVRPEECVMIGDRIDTDIVPARVLGMRTVLFRTGRHREQQPRAFDEVPDVEVTTVEELERALDALIAAR